MSLRRKEGSDLCVYNASFSMHNIMLLSVYEKRQTRTWEFENMPDSVVGREGEEGGEGRKERT